MKFITLAIITIATILVLQAKAQIYDTNNDVVEIFAGSGNVGSINAQGTLASFSSPSQVVSDTFSNLYILDKGNFLIRKIIPNGTVSTFAGGGNGTLPGYGTSISINGGPLYINHFGTMVIDQNNTIWISCYSDNYASGGMLTIGSNGYVQFLAYSGMTASSGICVDSGNNIFFTAGNQIFRISSQGVLTLVAGSTGGGNIDQNGIYASFNSPTALAADTAGNIYVWDSGNYLIRRIDQYKNVTTIAGNGTGPNADGVGLNAQFGSIYSMFGDNNGNIIMACGSCIRKMTAATNVVTIAGSFTQSSYANGAGALARFNGATGIWPSQGMYFVADSSNNRIRQISFNPQPQVVSGANLGIATYAGVTINGFVGRTYQIQTSPDMFIWTTKTTLLLTGSPYLWFDLNPVSGNNFYRAVLLP